MSSFMKRRWCLPGQGPVWLASLVLLASGGSMAQGRDGASPATADERYRAERAACEREAPGQARTDCLREVAAARASARRHAAARPDESPEALVRNALQRCQAFSGERRSLCERMARGEGEASGSVEAGGVLRSLETLEPAPVVEVPLAPGVTVPAPRPAPSTPAAPSTPSMPSTTPAAPPAR